VRCVKTFVELSPRGTLYVCINVPRGFLLLQCRPRPIVANMRRIDHENWKSRKSVTQTAFCFLVSLIAAASTSSGGQQLHVTELAGGGFQAMPYDPDFERTMEIADEIMDKYRDTLAALAKMTEAQESNEPLWITYEQAHRNP